MYDKVDTNLNFVKREEETVEFWKKHDIFNKSLKKTEGGPEFSFYDGPPTANGKPHIGHVLTRAIKDIIPRYKTMKGCHVLRKAGWDTHGLPVELEVERQLNIDGKQEIEKYGVEPFIKKCKESVFKYVSEWRAMSERIAYWVDMDDPYVTYHDKYIESVWWSIKEIHKKRLLYKGHKIVPYCPRCGTALSSHEVAQGYKDVTENTAIVKFRVKDKTDTFLLAWTTTPWTLPSNVALCMHPDYDYSLVESADEGTAGQKFILAKELIAAHFTNYKILETKKGRKWERLAYEPLFPFYKKEDKNCFYVVADTYVTLSDGTGIVHIAPAFGEDDAKVGLRYGLPFVQLVNEAGRFVQSAGQYAGMFVKDADKHLLKDLRERGLLKQILEVAHSYPFCWRCDTPLLYYARPTWFIKMTAVRESLMRNNAAVNWMPDSIGKGRMGNFLENVVDWGLSRERYWGTPLPVWVCPDCGQTEVIGSKAELVEKGKLKGDIELHKPYVDGVVLDCPKCKGRMKRTSEVIDCWYDSGAMPFAQYHYPFENKDLFEKTFPASFISEAVDQTRGWFYTLMAISTLLFDREAYQNCIVLGHVTDKNGVKMNKSKGNGIEPSVILNKQGADAVRWYFYTSSSLWLSTRFYEEAVVEGQRKFLGTLWNTYSFYVLYAEIDKFDPTEYSLDECKLTLMDKWVLSGLNTLTDTVDKNLAEYKILESAREIGEFTDSLSNWYVRRCRERFWAGGMEDDKKAAYMTLFTVLKNLCLIAAPFVPFITESIYQNIVLKVDKKTPESIHLCDYPAFESKYVDKKLEKGMDLILKAAAVGRAARNAANIKNRQPLGRMLLSAGSGTEIPSAELLEILKGELNVKEIEFASDASEYLSYEVKPQLKTLGPKYGAKLALIREKLAANGEEIAAAVKNGGVYSMDLGGETAVLSAEDLLIGVINRPGYSAASDRGVTAVLDITLTPELIREGFMRELVSKIQTMRKDAGFEVTDHIALYFDTADTDIQNVFKTLGAEIARDVFAGKIEQRAGGTEWDINGRKVFLQVERV